MENNDNTSEKTNNIITINNENKQNDQIENKDNNNVLKTEQIPQNSINIINDNKTSSQINTINKSTSPTTLINSNTDLNLEANLNINKESKKIKSEEDKTKNKFNQEVQKYIYLNIKDVNYTAIIENHPETLFALIDEEKLFEWQASLFNTPLEVISEEYINSIEENCSFQKVIKNDCIRTRVRESILLPNFKENLEKIITSYCKKKNLYYKQGLNEIFGPLILMMYKLKNLNLKKIFSIGEKFIDRFLPNYFYEKELYSLKSSLALFIILLKYHEPSVFNRLDSMEILPEMYATNWVMTLMSGKVKLDVLFEMWDTFIKIDDQLFLHYLLVALIKDKREIIINCNKNLLAPLMTALTIISVEELKRLVEIALNLRLHTPYSFRILSNKIGLMKPNNPNIKENCEKYKPLSIPAMPIFPLEIFYITYNNIIECPDPDCDNSVPFKKIITPDGKEKFKIRFEIIDEYMISEYSDESSKHICEKCDLSIEKKNEYFLMDLRILEYGENEENETDRTAYLPKMINVEQDDLKSEEIDAILTNRYLPDRGNYHLIFLTSTTDVYNEFENEFYKDSITELERRKIIYGVMEDKKREKELKLNAENTGNISTKQIYKLKEYDNLKKILISMQKQNFPYIGYVYGGFNALHEESFNYDIELLNHNRETCILCQERKKKKKNHKQNTKKNKEEDKNKSDLLNKLWEHKKRIKYNEINKYFKNPKIVINFCSLIEYKSRNLSSENIQILIASKLDQFNIEIYKFDIKNQLINQGGKSNYYDLGIDGEEKKYRELILLENLNVKDILTIKVDKKLRNIIDLGIRDDNDDKDKEKSQDKNKEKNMIEMPKTYNMIIDFSSTNDCKNFFKIFRKMTEGYRKEKKSIHA